jgi:hypothetical protein
MLYIDRLSQRGLRDAFSSPMFRILFNYRGKSEISHSSISERLCVIDLRFFEEVYNLMYQRLSSLYTKKEIAGMYFQRVDSTLVKETCNKLKEGLTWNNDWQLGKMIKYILDFDGMFASFPSMHKWKEYNVESLALSENVFRHCKKENQLGYKTAIRRMGIELESLIMAIVVIQSGGDLRKTDLPDP